MAQYPPWLRPSAWAIFDELLMRANHEEANGLKRGQAFIGVRELAEVIGVSPRRIRTIFQKLQAANQTQSQTTNKGTIVTIKNFDSYVTPAKKNDKLNDKPNGTSEELGDKRETAAAPVRDATPPSGTVLDRDKLIACIKQDRGLVPLLRRIGAADSHGFELIEGFVSAHLQDGDPIALLHEVTEEVLSLPSTNGKSRLESWKERMGG